MSKREIFKTSEDIRKASQCIGLRKLALEDFKKNYPEKYELILKIKWQYTNL